MNEIDFWKMVAHSGTAMAHSGTAERIYKLETLFEINRDNTKIFQMNKDIEAYEQAVKEKAILDEQARLRQLEA